MMSPTNAHIGDEVQRLLNKGDWRLIYPPTTIHTSFLVCQALDSTYNRLAVCMQLLRNICMLSLVMQLHGHTVVVNGVPSCLHLLVLPFLLFFV